MIERIIIIDTVDPQTFYGPNNANMSLIRNLYPKLRVSARGNVIKVLGEEGETQQFEKKIRELEAWAAKYNKLTEENIIDMVRGEAVRRPDADGVIIYGQTGRPISPRNANQSRMVRSFQENDLTFALGPAGTGKTYIAIALAVRALKNKECRRLILSRPAVEAGEKLGFLPGDMKDKIDSGTIQIAPLAFMRGRTLNDAVIILDEAQNTTTHQMKMFLTRLGMNSKMVVTGDVTQIDLPHSVRSGLLNALRILKGVKGIGVIEYEKKDIVRHPLVQRIVDAYEHREKEVAAEERREMETEETDND